MRVVAVVVGVSVCSPAFAQAPRATPPSTTSTAPATAASVVAGVQSFYDRVTDFEAQFSQVSTTAISGNRRNAEGTVRFQRGGRMRWDYTTPAGDVIVSDGQTILTYEASSRQLTRTPAAQMSIANAFAFLVGGARIANDFDARLLFDHTAAYPTGFVIELRPRHPHPSIDHIVLYVDGTSYQVTKASIADAQRNTNAITFLPPRVNQHIDPTVFHWTPPANAQLVHP